MVNLSKKILAGSLTFLLLLILYSVILPGGEEKSKKIETVILAPTAIIGDKYKIDSKKGFYNPAAAAADYEGNIYVLDRGNDRVAKYTNEGEFLLSWGRKGDGPGEFRMSYHGDQIFIDLENNVFVSSQRNNRVQVFDSSGKYLRGFRIRNSAYSISVDSKGFIYLSMPVRKMDDKLIDKYNRKGKLISQFGSSFLPKRAYRFPPHFAMSQSINQIVHDESDNLFLVYTQYPLIEKYSPDHRLLWRKAIDIKKIPGITDKDIEPFRKSIDYDSIKYNKEKDFYSITFFSSVDFYKDYLYLRLYRWHRILQIDEAGQIRKVLLLDDFVIPRLPMEANPIKHFVGKILGEQYIYSTTGSCIFRTESADE